MKRRFVMRKCALGVLMCAALRRAAPREPREAPRERRASVAPH
jgi:hypothetical protein